MIKVDDPADPRVEPYRAVRDRDLAGRAGRFVAEGEVVVRLLLSSRSRFEAESLLVAEDRIAALRPWLDGVPPGVPVYVAAKRAMAAVVGFPIHRGVLAMGRRHAAAGAGDLVRSLPERALVLVLVGISNHDNVGGAFRNAAAFGADAVILDATSCDPLYRKALRVSVGACLLVPFAHVPLAQGGGADAVVAGLRDEGFEPVALSPGGNHGLDGLRWPARTALLVGSEGAGLPPGILSRCPTVAIPMAPGFDSLNVATATGIALHAWRSGRAASGRPGAIDDPLARTQL